MERRRVLVIEDEVLINKFLESRLRKEELDVDVAYDGLEAIDLINRNRYDLVITDLMLPNVAGLELVMNIRRSELNTGTPVIVLSSLSSDDVIEDVLSIGAQDYIAKPFSIHVVLAKVKQLLSLAQSSAA